MKPFRHIAPSFRTFAGEDCLSALAGELRRLGASRAVIFCGASMARHGDAMARVERALGPLCAGRFDGVREHSPVPIVEEGARVLRQLGADSVIAVGGGSAVVTARASSILLAEQADVRQLCTQQGADGRLTSPRLDRPKLPQWVVATTPTTAYAKAGSAVQDAATGERLALFDPKTRAQGVFFDPVLAGTAPAALALTASLNALSMAIEGIEADVDDPLAMAQLREAVELLAGALPQLSERPDDPDLRLRLMLAALLCGQGTDHAGGGLSSVLSHVLGPRFGLPNGLAGAILLPHTMRFNAVVTAPRLPRVARALGASAEDARRLPAESTVAAVVELLHRLPIERRLRDRGIERDSLAAVADDAMRDWFMQRNPRRVERNDALAVLQQAW
ncbi:MAG: iron-containing alcohol dehydrogenase family protein [Burkholderiaceae bacterium]